MCGHLLQWQQETHTQGGGGQRAGTEFCDRDRGARGDLGKRMREKRNSRQKRGPRGWKRGRQGEGFKHRGGEGRGGEGRGKGGGNSGRDLKQQRGADNREKACRAHGLGVRNRPRERKRLSETEAERLRHTDSTWGAGEGEGAGGGAGSGAKEGRRKPGGRGRERLGRGLHWGQRTEAGSSVRGGGRMARAVSPLGTVGSVLGAHGNVFI